jgi:hypothetical protein
MLASERFCDRVQDPESISKHKSEAADHAIVVLPDRKKGPAVELLE